MADHLENLLDLLDKSWMIDGLRQFNVAEMAGTFIHALTTGGTLELTVNGAEAWIVQAVLPWLCPGLIHGLRVLDSADRHVFDLFG